MMHENIVNNVDSAEQQQQQQLQKQTNSSEIVLHSSASKQTKRPSSLKKVSSVFTPIRIRSIQRAELVNHKYYGEGTLYIPSSIPGKRVQAINQEGLLENVDLKVTLEIPQFYLQKTSYEEFISSLSYRISTDYLPTNYSMSIQIISKGLQIANPYFYDETTNNTEEEPLLFSIEIPLYRGLPALGTLPFFTEFDSEKLLHFTVVFEGILTTTKPPSPISWYTRLMLSQFRDMKIVSTTTNSIDYDRINAALSSTKNYMMKSVQYLASSVYNVFSACRTITPPIHNIPPATSNTNNLVLPLPSNISQNNNNDHNPVSVFSITEQEENTPASSNSPDITRTSEKPTIIINTPNHGTYQYTPSDILKDPSFTYYGAPLGSFNDVSI